MDKKRKIGEEPNDGLMKGGLLSHTLMHDTEKTGEREDDAKTLSTTDSKRTAEDGFTEDNSDYNEFPKD